MPHVAMLSKLKVNTHGVIPNCCCVGTALECTVLCTVISRKSIKVFCSTLPPVSASSNNLHDITTCTCDLFDKPCLHGESGWMVKAQQEGYMYMFGEPCMFSITATLHVIVSCTPATTDHYYTS